MESPAARLLGAVGLLLLFYRALLFPAAAAVAPAEVDHLIEASRHHYSHERYEEALAPTLTLTGRYPAQAVYLERLSHIYHALRRFREEAETWHRFMDRSPTPWDACPAVAEAHTAAGDPTAATLAFEKCRAVAPWDPDAAFFLGRERERSARLDEAATLYGEALDMDAAHSDSELGLARLELYSHRFDHARKLALGVAERFPDHADATLIVAQAAQRTGNVREARDYFARTLRIAEDYFDAHVGIGILEFGQHEKDSARRHFERAIELVPSRRDEVAVWLERTGSTR